MNIIGMHTMALLLVLLAVPEAMAAKVYQWTDEEGVVHFSDTPPQKGAPTAVSEIEMDEFGPDDDADKYSIVNQLEQMVAWRRQAEEDHLAREKLQLEQDRLALEQKKASSAPVATPAENYYLPVYYPRLSYFPSSVRYPHHMRRHGHHNRHDHDNHDNHHKPDQHEPEMNVYAYNGGAVK